MVAATGEAELVAVSRSGSNLEAASFGGAGLTPGVDTMPAIAFLGALTLSTALLLTIGLRGFVRRTVG